MRAVAAGLMAFAAASAQADAFNDYARLLADKADQVVERRTDDGTVIRELTLEPGISVTEQTAPGGEPQYLAADLSEGGAVGCLLLIQVEVRMILGACPGSFPGIETATLDAQIERVSRWAAANAYPPLDADVTMGWVEERLAQGTDAACPDLGEANPDIGALVAWITGPEAAGWIDETLAEPRLPVMNPCL